MENIRISDKIKEPTLRFISYTYTPIELDEVLVFKHNGEIKEARFRTKGRPLGAKAIKKRIEEELNERFE